MNYLEPNYPRFRTSGLGDHGPRGIQDFISSHACNHICQGLELESPQVLRDTLDDLLQDVNRFFDDVVSSTSNGPLRPLSPSEGE